MPASSTSRRTGPYPARTMGGSDKMNAKTSVAGELTQKTQCVP